MFGETRSAFEALVANSTQSMSVRRRIVSASESVFEGLIMTVQYTAMSDAAQLSYIVLPLLQSSTKRHLDF